MQEKLISAIKRLSADKETKNRKGGKILYVQNDDNL